MLRIITVKVNAKKSVFEDKKGSQKEPWIIISIDKYRFYMAHPEKR